MNRLQEIGELAIPPANRLERLRGDKRDPVFFESFTEPCHAHGLEFRFVPAPPVMVRIVSLGK